jgi:hypothetical protein
MLKENIHAADFVPHESTVFIAIGRDNSAIYFLMLSCPRTISTVSTINGVETHI